MPWKIKLCIGKNNYFPDWYLAMGELAAREFDSQAGSHSGNSMVEAVAVELDPL
jgi:hypothetical protein